MADKVFGWAHAFFIVCMGALALAGTSYLIWSVWPEHWRGDGAAAWVQAIGSVLAIVAAIVIANLQHRATISLARRQAESSRREFAESCLALVEHVQAFMLALPGPASDEGQIEVFFAQYKSFKIFHEASESLRAC
ncbi:hypothetical protein [Ralstonia solanacearum]|uniref:hypothetical protein n=1 Tax=Ralstonia solanacearum TaxID=305 RepID=UPI0018D0F621|nr:hypothetical protein [Ralstonia solanacearum]